MWHLTREMWHVTHVMWHVTRGGRWTFPKNCRSIACTVWKWRYFLDIWEKGDSREPLIRAGELKFWEKVHLPPRVTCHMSHGMFHVSGVMCQVSVVTFQVSHVTCNSQTVRARKLKFLENVHLPPRVTCHMPCVMCQVSRVMCHASQFIYQQGLPRLVWIATIIIQCKLFQYKNYFNLKTLSFLSFLIWTTIWLWKLIEFWTIWIWILFEEEKDESEEGFGFKDSKYWKEISLQTLWNRCGWDAHWYRQLQSYQYFNNVVFIHRS